MKRRGFTLIELLIVIAIILILIAIALPNFLEAQIRARVTKVRGDLRTVQTALESYFTDFQQYPADHDPDEYSPGSNGLYQLTTPLSYIQAIPQDPFNTQSGLADPDDEAEFEMASTGTFPQIAHTVRPRGNVHAFNVHSHGPDSGDQFGCNDAWPFCSQNNPCANGDGWINYAPTNGSKSLGELVVLGGQHRAGGYCIDGWQTILGKF
jgi:type II secretion system protein G